MRWGYVSIVLAPLWRFDLFYSKVTVARAICAPLGRDNFLLPEKNNQRSSFSEKTFKKSAEKKKRSLTVEFSEAKTPFRIKKSPCARNQNKNGPKRTITRFNLVPWNSFGFCCWREFFYSSRQADCVLFWSLCFFVYFGRNGPNCARPRALKTSRKRERVSETDGERVIRE